MDFLLETLPDYLRPGLRALSVGLNPSIPSVRAGYYFANPRNRFWKALQGSNLAGKVLEPGIAAIETLFHEYDIGFTDLVKRPTPGAKQLTAADYRAGAPPLLDKIKSCQPAVVWIHGKLVWQNFLRFALSEDYTDHNQWGEQRLTLDGSHFFVTPNPSPANAVFSLQDLTGWYNELAQYLQRVTNHRAGSVQSTPC